MLLPIALPHRTKRLFSHPAFWAFGLALLLGIMLLPYRTVVARFLWNTWHAETVASSFDPTNPDLAFAIGEYYFNHGSYNIAKAKRFYDRAIALRPSFLEAHYQRARIDFIEGRLWSSLEHLKIVLELNPDFKKAYYLYGLVNGYNGNMPEAIHGFEEFIQRDSLNWAGYNDLAWVYFQLGDFQKTLTTAEAGLTQATGNVWLLNMRGLALMNLKRTTEAHQAFLEAKQAADKMRPSDWGVAYPGNDPAIYAAGLDKMREAIDHNLTLTE